MLIPSQIWGEGFEIDPELVKANLQEIKNKIAHSKVKIIAVTKYFGIDGIKAGYDAGLRDFGESRAVEAVEKIKALPDEIRKNSRFHFIGHLQSNKASKVVEHFDVIHSIDSLKIARIVSDSACRLNKREKILLQINNAGEIQKSGYTKEGLKQDMEEILKLEGIEVIGLMNIAPLGEEKETLHNLFRDIRVFRDSLEEEFKIKLPELSMGMSDDYQIALEEGATIIRIGRKLFIK